MVSERASGLCLAAVGISQRREVKLIQYLGFTQTLTRCLPEQAGVRCSHTYVPGYTVPPITHVTQRYHTEF